MRVSYEKEMREKAKSEGRGLITIDIVGVNGGRSTTQIRADEKELNYARRALSHLIRLVEKS
ncbi:MAG: hypothetical protein V3T08_09890 [Gemmatimonadota bacterium]